MNSTHHRESLSALADGALEPDALRFLMRRLDNDSESLGTWERYHLAGDVLRGQSPWLASDGFAERVQMRLQRLPAGQARHRWLRWSAGGAIAASVAAVALMVAQPQVRPATSAPADTAAVGSAAGQPALASAPSAASEAQPSSPAQVPRWLMANNPAAQMAQPAAATFYGVGQGMNTLVPASYSPQVAPYMNIQVPRDGVLRHRNGVRYLLIAPSARQPDPHRAATTRSVQ